MQQYHLLTITTYCHSFSMQIRKSLNRIKNSSINSASSSYLSVSILFNEKNLLLMPFGLNVVQSRSQITYAVCSSFTYSKCESTTVWWEIAFESFSQEGFFSDTSDGSTLVRQCATLCFLYNTSTRNFQFEKFIPENRVVPKRSSFTEPITYCY